MTQRRTRYNLFVHWNKFTGVQTVGDSLVLEEILPIVNDLLSHEAFKIVIEAAEDDG